MKKSELTQLTQVIEHLVAREVRKQLPTLISEVFRNMMENKSIIAEKKVSQEPAQIKAEVECLQNDFKSSLTELFAGPSPKGVKESNPVQETHVPKTPHQYTKNPVLNQILNETTGDLRYRERMVGAAAFQGGYSPTSIAAPAMPGGDVVDGAPGEQSPSLAALPQGTSVLDIAKQMPLAAPVAKALTRDYSQVMKLIDKKRKGTLA